MCFWPWIDDPKGSPPSMDFEFWRDHQGRPWNPRKKIHWESEEALPVFTDLVSLPSSSRNSRSKSLSKETFAPAYAELFDARLRIEGFCCAIFRPCTELKDRSPSPSAGGAPIHGFRRLNRGKRESSAGNRREREFARLEKRLPL